MARGLKRPEFPKRYLGKFLLPKLACSPACDFTPADVGIDTLNVALKRVPHGLAHFTLPLNAGAPSHPSSRD